MNNADILFHIPIILLSAFATLSIVVDAMKKKSERLTFSFTNLGYLSALLATGFAYVVMNPVQNVVNSFAMTSFPSTMTNYMTSFSRSSFIFDMVFILAGLFSNIAARNYLRKNEFEKDEFYSLVQFAVAGMMVISHSNHLLTLFIGIEIMSISFYTLAGYFRFSLRSIEASLKYFILGSFSTAFTLMGISMLYGAIGSMDFNMIHKAMSIGLSTPFQKILLSLGGALLVIGFGFKVAAFPFHQWAADAYDGAPSIMSGFLSGAGKVAAIAAFASVFGSLIPYSGINYSIAGNIESFRTIIAVLSGLTMLFGNIVAISQKSVKRMLAYSSIAHAGYLLIGIVSANERGAQGIVFYAVSYFFMQFGAFTVISMIEKKGSERLAISDYAGLGKTNPILAAIMSIFMFSLAGIPPLSGFFGKYYLFVSAFDAGYWQLAIVAIISSIISVYFYIGLVLQMYFKEPAFDEKIKRDGACAVAAICAVVTLLIGLFPQFLLSAGK